MSSSEFSEEASRSRRFGALILAAGYGTRLERDMRSDPAFHPQVGTPKPLLPIGGSLLIDHWLSALLHFGSTSHPCTLSSVVVVTNDAHSDLYTTWAAGLDAMPFKVCVETDGSTENASRRGAVADMQIGLDSLEDVAFSLIIAGDTLLPGIDLAGHVERFATDPTADIGVFAYELPDPDDCRRRGMLRVGEDGTAAALVEKPPTVAESPSNLATAPVYFVREGAGKRSVRDFLERAEAENASLESCDAPGFWLCAALAAKRKCLLFKTDSRVDIGGLEHYKTALADLAEVGDGKTRLSTEPAVGRALPRVGLLGNPSDGYGGACVAFTVESEGFAEVVATPADHFEVVPNPAHEQPPTFENLAAFGQAVADAGVQYGARRLVLAGAAVFDLAWRNSGRASNTNCKCILRYSTTIPTCIGLSGSSALVLATVRALARYNSVTLKDLDPNIAKWPAKILAAETEMLCITGGLMDRVAQVYGGLMYMDFSKGQLPVVTRFSHDILPELWLLSADTTVCLEAKEPIGEDSGVVHGSLRARHAAGEKCVVEGMRDIAGIANLFYTSLQYAEKGEKHCVNNLPVMMAENWELRQQMVGAPSTDINVELVRVAESAGLIAKQTGSGGAVVCVPNLEAASNYSAEKVISMKQSLLEQGFRLRQIVVGKQYTW